MSRLRATALATAVLALSATPTPAQRDTVVVAGERYHASAFKRFLWGSSYRGLWTAPVRVPVLDLSTYVGGLTPTRLGGGLQTHALHFRSGDGREFAFRSVDKDPTQSLPRDLQRTLVSRVDQDQVSSLVPAAGVAAHGVEAAAGLAHTTERLFLMPDDPRLGEFRARFAGMLGTLEERPEVSARTLGAETVVDTDTMLAALESGPGERLDDRGYLAARLVDFVLGDWDRHGGQYEWLRFSRPGGHLWRVFPRDRDYAFVDYDGLLLSFARGFIPNTPRYRGRIDLHPLLLNAAPLDHRLLGNVDHAAWDSVTRAVVARLTDARLDSAIAALPPEWREREGARLAALLRARRDDLSRVSRDFYRTIAREVEAHGTDAADLAEVERLPGGNVRVTVRSADGGEPLYRRELSWVESREVRVYLHGGGDRARVSGTGQEQVIVRVIGGSGDDDLADEGRAGHHTAFYDDAGRNRYTRRPHTKVDERGWATPKWTPGGGKFPARDWGFKASAFAPSGGWHHAGTGPYLAIGPSWTRYGFRREPYAVKQSFRFMWLVQHGRFGAEYKGDFRVVGRPMDRTEALVRVSEMEASRFFGFGNATVTGGLTHDHFTVFERQMLADAQRWWGIGRGAWLVGGLTGRFTDAEPVPGSPSDLENPRGIGDYLAVGGRAGVVLDRTDSTVYHRSGFTLSATGSGFPLTSHDADAFGLAQALGTAYLS
ncbi:MAG: hypothetical protein ACJ8GN_23195, partial [Longimicrobiaceae bacterium]